MLQNTVLLLWRLVAIALAKEVRPPVNKAKVLGWVVPVILGCLGSFFVSVRCIVPGVRFLSCLLKALLPFVGVAP